MSIQNSINQAIGVASLVATQTPGHEIRKEAHNVDSKIKNLQKESQVLGKEIDERIKEENLPKERADELRKAYDEYANKNLIEGKKLLQVKARYTNKQSDWKQAAHAQMYLMEQDIANEKAEALKQSKLEQMENLKIRFSDNSEFQLSPELMARAQIKENK